VFVGQAGQGSWLGAVHGQSQLNGSRILLEGDLQNRVCGIVTMKLAHDGSMMQSELQRAKVDRDSEFDTTRCYDQHYIQKIDRYTLYSNQFV
jgi:hypothetical protein